MEDQSVIKALLYQLFEVLAGDRCNLRIQFDLDLLSVFHFNDYHCLCSSQNHIFPAKTANTAVFPDIGQPGNARKVLSYCTT